MPTPIKMPQMSDTMDSGKILEWLKKEGEIVERGDVLAEIETDKANLEIESFEKGVLLKIIAGTGQTAAVGDVIAYIGEEGEEIDAAAPAVPKPSAAEEEKREISSVKERTGAATQQTVSSANTTGRIIASPLARKIAAERNLDLSLIKGTGPNGRITRRDIENTLAEPVHKEKAGVSEPSPSRVEEECSGKGTLSPFSRMRASIAKRMQQSVHESPHFYVTTAVNMGEAVRLRELLKDDGRYKGISFTHMILKAAAYGISREPVVNYSVKDSGIFEPDSINIGIVTAVEGGLLIPVIKDTDKLSLHEVVAKANEVIERARKGSPASSDLSGGTFTISNLGMFDVDSFTAIINPGQGSVLAVGAIAEKPVVQNSQIIPGRVMKATISVDHRVIDGVVAGNFLKHFKQALETPALLMV